MVPCNEAHTGSKFARHESEQTSHGSLFAREFEEPELRKESQLTAERQSSTGAPSRDFDDWESIDWQIVARHVQRLQMRIAKAVREGRYGKVKVLQRLLTRSFLAKLWAVRRVVTNPGKRTPGVDGVAWRTPKAKMKAARSLRRRGYRPQPLRRVYIPKSNGKKRGLGIPTMKDRAMQALYLLALNPIAESVADPNSYGFRLERSTSDAVQQCLLALSRKNSAEWILDADIEAFFDQLSHAWLLDHVPMDKEVLRKWLKAGILEEGFVHPTETGTPQGGIISPVLANIALDGLERFVKESAPKTAKVNVIRYADDVLITGASREVLENCVRPAMEAFLEERGLRLSPEKTKIVHIETGVDFLGANLRKYDGKYRPEPAKKSVQSFLQRIRGFIRTHPTIKQEDLIHYLNPRIRGWANHFRYLCASKAFKHIDHHIFRSVWRWAKRRHPEKQVPWVYDRYYRSRVSRKWIFSTQARDSKGQAKTLDLVNASSVPIRRHVKIRAKATIFDPEYEEYFRLRRLRRKRPRRRRSPDHSHPGQLSLWPSWGIEPTAGSQECGL